MRITRLGEFYVAQRITGPQHNLLQLELHDGILPSYRERIEALPAIGGSAVRLDGARIRTEVLAGVAEANAALASSFTVIAIRFVEDDTPPESFYRFLAYKIIKAVAEGLVPFRNPPK